MDCVKLRQDIEKLTEKKNALSAAFDKMNETNTGRNKVFALMEEAESLENSVLEEYLEDFKEKNQDVFSKWEWKEIELFRHPDYPWARAIVSLPNGKFLIGGEDYFTSVLREYDPTKSGFWSLSDKIKGFEDPISGIFSLPNGKCLVAGLDGELREYDPISKTFSDRIEGFNSSIESVSPLPNGRLLVGGGRGELREYDPISKTFSDKIEGFEGDIFAISPLLVGKLLIAGGDGELREYDPGKLEWERLGDKIEGFENDIYTISPLPNGKLLIAGRDGELREYNPYTKEFSDKIEGIEGNIMTSSSLPNGKVLFGTWYGELCEYDSSKPEGEKLDDKIRVFGAHLSLGAISISSDGKVLVAGSEQSIAEMNKVSLRDLTIEDIKKNLDILGGEDE